MSNDNNNNKNNNNNNRNKEEEDEEYLKGSSSHIYCNKKCTSGPERTEFYYAILLIAIPEIFFCAAV